MTTSVASSPPELPAVPPTAGLPATPGLVLRLISPQCAGEPGRGDSEPVVEKTDQKEEECGGHARCDRKAGHRKAGGSIGRGRPDGTRTW